MEKQQKVVEAKGEAKSVELVGKAVAQNAGFLNLRKIDAAREIAHMVCVLPALICQLNVNDDFESERLMTNPHSS